MFCIFITYLQPDALNMHIHIDLKLVFKKILVYFNNCELTPVTWEYLKTSYRHFCCLECVIFIGEF